MAQNCTPRSCSDPRESEKKKKKKKNESNFNRERIVHILKRWSLLKLRKVHEWIWITPEDKLRRKRYVIII